MGFLYVVLDILFTKFVLQCKSLTSMKVFQSLHRDRMLEVHNLAGNWTPISKYLNPIGL